MHKAPETPAVAASDKIIQLYDTENNNMITDDLKSKMLARYQQEINILEEKYFK